MTTITIEQSLLEQALNALLLPCDRWNKQQFLIVKGAIESLNAALVAPATTPAQPERKPMTKGQREQVARRAEAAMNGNVNLSWRDALISETEAFHDIKETP